MTEVNLQSLFSSIDKSADDLNALSDEANRALQDVQNRLVSCNIGFEIWYETPIAYTDSEGGIGADQQSVNVVDLLGYARAEGSWCLAVKRIRRVSGFFQGEEDCPYTEDFLESPPAPLLKQSRDIRTRAVAVLPEFLAFVAEEIRQKSQSIAKATNSLAN